MPIMPCRITTQSCRMSTSAAAAREAGRNARKSLDLRIDRTAPPVAAMPVLLARFRRPIVAPITGIRWCPHDTQLHRPN